MNKHTRSFSLICDLYNEAISERNNLIKELYEAFYKTSDIEIRLKNEKPTDNEIFHLRELQNRLKNADQTVNNLYKEIKSHFRPL